MLISAFRALWLQLIVIAGIFLVCALIVWGVAGKQPATDFLSEAVVGMKGPWVWTFGWGLAAFVTDRGRTLPTILGSILDPNEVTAEAANRLEKATLHRSALLFTVPITVIGFFLTLNYGIPNTGIAHFLLLIGVCSIYYVAAFLLFHFIQVIMAFHGLFESMERVDFRRIYSPLHLENLTSYLSISITLGLIAIYAGFRGTLTAGFHFHAEVWRSFLVTPLILFLPGTLLYNYYPRYVLRKTLQYRVFRAMERLSSAEDEVAAQKLLIDMKEASLLNSQILPFLDYKSLPSYAIAIVFVITVAYENDPVVNSFFKYLVNIGTK